MTGGLDIVALPIADRGADVAVEVRQRLDLTTASFVTFTEDGAADPTLDKFETQARKIAARCGLTDVGYPLIVLNAVPDGGVMTAYRAWAAKRGAGPELDAYLRLLPYRKIGASLHGIDVLDGGATIRLTGTCRRDGTEGATPPDHPIELRLVDRSGQVRLKVATVPRLRYEDSAERWTGFTADVSVEQLPLGCTTLEFEVPATAGQGVLRSPLAAADGALASSRPLTVGDLRLQVVPASGTEHAQIIVRPDRKRLRWSLAMARRDLRALVRLRPFSWVRPARALTRPFHARGPIWLIGERPGTARDNGFHLFTHLCSARPDIRAYYVIDTSSDQYERVSGLGRVIAHSSWRHRLLMLHAAVLANAYSTKHMVPKQWDSTAYMRQFAWRIGSFRVYLKHGINLNTKALRRRIGGYDLYLTATEAETAAARLTSGYDRQITLTGMPRYDALIPTPPSRTILFMPTWRLYFVGTLFTGEGADAEFEGSAYQRFMTDFLASPRLRDLLDRHDYRLQFMPHYNLREHLAGIPVGSERITVLDGAAGDIQDVMRACDLFVTDHSSVHFDVAYLGTPVVYSHFDAGDYRTGHADTSWFDHERDGFGPVTYDLEATLDAMERYLSTECRREGVYTERAEKAFAFHDQGNSRRTVTAIEELLNNRTS